MDRLARNLDNLCKLVFELTRCGITVQFVEESLVFTDKTTRSQSCC